MQNLIEVKNAGFYYEAEKFCFRNLSFELASSQTLAILGLNGQGKSTLMSCMMGILQPKEGEIVRKAKFAFLPHSVLDIVLMGRVREISLFSKPGKKDIQICLDALDTLGVAHLQKRSFNALSGGQRQLVLFARALASGSDVLFLDEPASALDIKNQDRVLSLIANLRSNSDASIVFTTHQPNHALAVADRTLILRNDLSYNYGASNEILTEAALSSLYGVQIKTTEFDIEGEQIPSITQIFSAQVK